uniref:Uncharacterized protein n=1 Tax=Anopheles minimus TaxID=112268 RepID=A0A182WNL2_9DIPT
MYIILKTSISLRLFFKHSV